MGDGNIIESLLKHVIASANKYTFAKSEVSSSTFLAALNDLHKSSLDGIQYVLISESITSLTTVLHDNYVSLPIAKEIILFLIKAVEKPLWYEIMKVKLDVPSTIGFFVCSNETEEKSIIIPQCLQLMKTLTYDIRITSSNLSLPSFIKFLIKHILASQFDDSFGLVCLEVFVNVIRKSSDVQTLVKQHENVDGLYKSLLRRIQCKQNRFATINALLAITVLSHNDSIGKKLFQANNINQILELVFNIIVNGETESRCCALDLFIEMAINPNIQGQIDKYKHLEVSLEKIITLIKNEKQNKLVGKLFEFLSAMCHQNILSSKILSLMLKMELSSLEPVSFAIEWMKQNDSKVAVQATTFIHYIFKFVGKNYDEAPDFSTHFSSVLIIANHLLSLPVDLTKYESRNELQKQLAMLNLILSFCENEYFIESVSRELDIECVIQYIEKNVISSTTVQLDQTSDLRNLLMDVTVESIRLMFLLKPYSEICNEKLVRFLQNSHIIQSIAKMFCSNSKNKVLEALQLLLMTSNIKEFPLNTLVENISCIVMEKDNLVITDLIKPPATAIKCTSCSSAEVYRHNNNEKSVDAVIEKIEKGLKIQDIKPSELMEMYERKISSLEIKNSHLERFAEAKSIALQQAERLLAQYQRRWAQSDADAFQLRVLLKDSEQRSEAAKEKATSIHIELQNKLKLLEMAESDINKLQQFSSEQREALILQIEKYENEKRTVMSLQDELKKVGELKEMIQRHMEEYKRANEELKSKLSEKDIKIKTLIHKSKEQEDRNKELHDLNEKINAKLNTADNKIQSLRNELEGKLQLEQEYIQLQNKLEATEKQLTEYKELNEAIQNMISRRK